MKREAVLQKLADVCRLKHLSRATEKAYALWVRAYMDTLAETPAEWTREDSPAAVRSPLDSLTVR